MTSLTYQAPAVPSSAAPRTGRRWQELLLLWLLLVFTNVAQAAICRVVPNGTGDGSNWAQAASLQTALATSTCTDIWVRQGTYTPTDTGDRSAHFAIRRNLKLLGGFGGSESDISERASMDPALTILSGAIGDPAVATDNSFQLLLLDSQNVPNGLTAATVIEGFTLRDAYGNGGFPNNIGAGLLCRSYSPAQPCSPTFSRLIFDSNFASFGGAMALYTECCFNGSGGPIEPTITDTIFINNRAQSSGGAIYASTQAITLINATLSRVSFINNSAHLGNTIGPGGGAIYLNAGGQGGRINLLVRNATFNGNFSPSTFGRGGAIFNNGIGGESSIHLIHTTFSDNTAAFQGNSANAGQVIYNDYAGASTLIENSIISEQHPFRSGTAMPITQVRSSLFAQGTVCPDYATCTDDTYAAPLLGPLQNNGAGTPTRLPQAGSPAIDAIDCTDTSTDQRGVTRPQGLRCDLGAVERNQTTLTLNIQGEGSVTASPAPALPLGNWVCDHADAPCLRYYDQDENPVIAVAATPDTFWQFDRWQSDCQTSTPEAASISVDITAIASCTARFIPVQYVVSATTPGGNGNISPASQLVDHGSTASFTVTPNTGYHLDTVTGDTCTPQDNGNGAWTTSAITSPCAVVASFVINQYTVTASVTGQNGSISPASQSVDHGSAASFNVTANPGYHTDSLSGDTCAPADMGGGTWRADTITEDCSVAAAFAQNPPASVDVITGDTQDAPVYAAFATPLSVRVSDAANVPLSGINVSFTAPASGASSLLSASSALTDVNGIAEVLATANATVGAYQVTASVGTLSSAFSLSNTALTPTVSLSANTTQTSGNVTLTATVSGTQPTGNVDFLLANGTVLCAARPLINEIATCIVWLPAGNNIIHADYSGDAVHLPATSPAITVVSSPAPEMIPLTSIWTLLGMALGIGIIGLRGRA